MTPFPTDTSGTIPDLASEWSRRILESEAGKFDAWKPTRAELTAYLREAIMVGIRFSQDVILRSENHERKRGSNRRHVLDACFGLRKELSSVIEACE